MVPKPILKGLTGKSPAIREVNRLIHKASRNDYPLLISGETGVGKSMAAECIHRLSRRGSKSFLQQGCSNIPAELFESELFGHEKGAFTGAVRRRAGKMEIAAGGTLFLDEVADLGFDCQSKILLFLDKGKFFRLGGEEEIEVDVRIIAASNKDLKEEIKAGRFREDLYFRLNVFEIHIPPLRERKEDIPLLVNEILKEAEKRNKVSKKIFSPAMEKLMGYYFPGNIRELENIVLRAFVMAEADVLKPDDIKIEPMSYREEDIVNKLFKLMVRHGMSFWEAMHKPFLQRELNRR
ncbi:MAG: sigma-54 dependent transcriptional regulator, partial [Acidobacteriota bacterium]|nr:sigma-54 dependent transcriptional regulator [Acidobacteriota bacterium]